jgi:DNA-3-methyladenine glycosylase
MKYQKQFFMQSAINLAPALLGQNLVRIYNQEKLAARIVETEAYLGPEDKAAHSYKNKKTKRTKIMFETGGFVYIYKIYGIHFCLNIVADNEKPEAVLIRAVEPIYGIETMKKNRKINLKNNYMLTNGPGKLTQAMKIDSSLHAHDLTKNEEIYIEKGTEPDSIEQSPRINISYAEEYKDKPWRFYIKNNPYISKK